MDKENSTAILAKRIKEESECEGVIVILVYKDHDYMSIKLGSSDLSPVDEVTAMNIGLEVVEERQKIALFSKNV